MNQLKRLSFIVLSLFSLPVYAGSTWHAVAAREGANTRAHLVDNAQYKLYQLDNEALVATLNSAATSIIELPMPDGTMRAFRTTETHLLPAILAGKYPELKTYNGVAVDRPSITAKIDLGPSGFHAMIYNGNNTWFVDPVSDFSTNTNYIAKYKKDEKHKEVETGCQAIKAELQKERKYSYRTVNGYQLRTYRIAIACDHQYAQAAVGTETPNKLQTLNKVITSMNRINGVYERELSITMQLVDKEDTLLFINEATDPFGPLDSNPFGLMTLNQKYCDSLIGTTNYDLGHVFSTGAGGLSQIGCVCNVANKAQSVTGNSQPTGDGFDIDYVAHEIGHEFGADHTFNNNVSGSCAGNANPETAVEPGSGSTLMAYAGICGGDNVQLHSDDYFSTASLLQINTFVTTTADVCADKTNSGNKPPALATFDTSYYIPYQTPFELTAPIAIDSAADTLTTYCWEQFNLGDFGKTLNSTEVAGPLFRSYAPDTSRTRIFPHIEMVLEGQKSNAGINNAEGEKLPTVARFLTFRLTTRSILNGLGCFLFPDDSIHLDVINTGRGFTVTSQSTPNLKFIGTSVQTVTWDVANTTDAPISANEVDIYLSLDGGYTWTYNLGRFPNTGSAIITLPNPANTSNKARIKVKGAGNVFFNINGSDFSVISNPGIYGDILLFPVPAHNTVTIVTGDKGSVDAVVYNAAGRVSWKGAINGIYDLDVSMWPRGVYFIKMIDVRNQETKKKFVLE
ncbi:hypothetical protein CJD36_007425 [Flavipsychrobacter stenotrophus]|uniref:Secretion system C-terminal sorting domain-containing protein n=1 Tax=Flavipsychrobacter stenotrophus TaxID=2077091 RepID=A0A2S7SY39_9BACT|nr:M12 family metallo-peptidase [Flavipsychrobacter stenotrophus]PQJ11618.1 hypothetical protein CJD36_007425 [Flavipsychrobacter stenotrophus]